MARNRESVGTSGKVKDLSKDQEALEMMKSLEMKLSPQLVRIYLPDGTIVTSTKDRINRLLTELGYNNSG